MLSPWGNYGTANRNHPHLASATTCHIAVKAYTQQQDRRQARLTPGIIQPAYDVVIQRGTDEFVGLVLSFETHGP